MFDATINPYDSATIVRLAAERRVRWIIVKERLQLNGTPMDDLQGVLRRLGPRFHVAARLRDYTIYRGDG